MRDTRLSILAKNLVHYSIRLKPGEKVLIDMIGSERELVKCIVEEVLAAGGLAYVELNDRSVLRSILMGTNEAHMKQWADMDLNRMKQMDAYIAVRAGGNAMELSDVPNAKMKLYDTIYRKPVHLEQRVKHTKWVVLRYPNDSMAQLANMSTEAFEDFYFNVCNLDYSKMSKAMNPLAALMNRTNKVRIV
ncbi:MAG TPA: aminopeptidase, partial [Bacilli bacterium]